MFHRRGVSICPQDFHSMQNNSYRVLMSLEEEEEEEESLLSFVTAPGSLSRPPFDVPAAKRTGVRGPAQRGERRKCGAEEN